MKILCSIIPLVCLLVQSSFTHSSPDISHDPFPYGEHFRKYGAQYLPQVDFRLFAAQTKQESAFDKYAVSRAGARGLMQIMPATHDEQEQRLGIRCSPWSEWCNIMFGVHYDSRMFKIWNRRDRTVDQIIDLMLASYNAGAGTVIRAQSPDNARLFKHLENRLPRETQDYVRKVRGYFREFSE